MSGGASEADLVSIRHGLELFNAGDFETLYRDVFHAEIDFHGDPQISVLTGLPVLRKGAEQVRGAWEAFFAMFDDLELTDVELEPNPDGIVLGSCRMIARGGASEVPTDAMFHLAWVLRDGRWRFLAAKLDRDEVERALADWLR